MSNKVYDILNIIAKIIAPAATFIGALMTIWNIPYAEQVTATLAALDVFLGALVVIAKANYDKKYLKQVLIILFPNVKGYKERTFSGNCNPHLNKTEIKNGGTQ